MTENGKHTNDFYKSKSLEDKYDNVFEVFYEDFFYRENISSIEKINDRNWQMQGVDYIITLVNGKEVYVDNKVREKWYGDILIEEYSNYENQRLGWLLRDDVITEYVFYYIASIKKCIVFRHDEMKDFVLRNYEYLEKRRKMAKNVNYHTSNFPITLDELKSQGVNYLILETQ